jgi:hypothetical protein
VLREYGRLHWWGCAWLAQALSIMAVEPAMAWVNESPVLVVGVTSHDNFEAKLMSMAWSAIEHVVVVNPTPHESAGSAREHQPQMLNPDFVGLSMHHCAWSKEVACGWTMVPKIQDLWRVRHILHMGEGYVGDGIYAGCLAGISEDRREHPMGNALGSHIRAPHAFNIVNEDVGSQLTFGSQPHHADSLPRRDSRSSGENQAAEKQHESSMSRVCHKILSADVGVFTLFSSLLILIGWIQLLISQRPLTGSIILLLGVATLAVNKRDIDRVFCSDEEAYGEGYSHQSDYGQGDPNVFGDHDNLKAIVVLSVSRSSTPTQALGSGVPVLANPELSDKQRFPVNFKLESSVPRHVGQYHIAVGNLTEEINALSSAHYVFDVIDIRHPSFSGLAGVNVERVFRSWHLHYAWSFFRKTVRPVWLAPADASDAAPRCCADVMRGCLANVLKLELHPYWSSCGQREGAVSINGDIRSQLPLGRFLRDANGLAGALNSGKGYAYRPLVLAESKNNQANAQSGNNDGNARSNEHQEGPPSHIFLSLQIAFSTSMFVGGFWLGLKSLNGLVDALQTLVDRRKIKWRDYLRCLFGLVLTLGSAALCVAPVAYWLQR